MAYKPKNIHITKNINIVRLVFIFFEIILIIYHSQLIPIAISQSVPQALAYSDFFYSAKNLPCNLKRRTYE
jgi:hypothetical protein